MAYSDKLKQAAYAKKHYALNRQKMIARAALHSVQYRKKLVVLIEEYLSWHPCKDCGCEEMGVLEFDHRDPSLKKFNIREAQSRGFGLATLKEEISKCDVRCANCHRRRTHEQRILARQKSVVYTLSGRQPMPDVVAVN